MYLKAGAQLGELGVDARRLVERALDDADVRDLAAEMEVEELEAVLHAARLELLEAAHDLGDREAELRPEAAGRLPAPLPRPPASPRMPICGRTPDLLRGVDDQPQLGVFLDDRDDVAADLLAEHRRLDELGVLEPVADDRRRVVGERATTASSSGFEPASRPKL